MKIFLVILILSISTFAASLTAPTMVAQTNSKTTVSISAEGNDIIAAQFVFYYDDTALSPMGDLSNYWGCMPVDFALMAVCNGGEEGVYRVAMYGAYGFSGEGVLLNIPFYTHKGGSDLDLEDVYMFDESGPVSVKVIDGGIDLQ